MDYSLRYVSDEVKNVRDPIRSSAMKIGRAIRFNSNGSRYEGVVNDYFIQERQGGVGRTIHVNLEGSREYYPITDETFGIEVVVA